MPAFLGHPTNIQNSVDTLEELADEIEKNFSNLLNNAKFSRSKENYLTPFPFPEPFDKLHRNTIRQYQKWYSMSLTLISEFIPSKITEFTSVYEKQGYWGGMGVFNLIRFDTLIPSDGKRGKIEIINEFRYLFEIQRSIILSVPDVAKINENSLREIISANFVDREIEEAEYLYHKKFYRCAGALAGVALEQYLRMLCNKYGLEYQKKDTIEPLVRKLYENKKIEIEQLKNIQHLATIRDLCDHPSDIDANKVKELIERVKKLI